MSNNWNQITKYLDTVVASVNTTRDKLRGKARPICKLNYGFTLPSASLTSTIFRTLRYQVNYSLPSDFRIIGFASSETPFSVACVKCIRYRVDDQVYRYRLPFVSNLTDDQAMEDLLTFNYIVQAPLYSGQVIKKNFCIEFWGTFNGTSNNRAWTYTTSLLTNPSSPDEASPIIYSSGESVDRSVLESVFPETLPTTYNDAGAWLNNI